MSLRSSPARYGSLAQGLHWLTALLIVCLFIAGNVMDDLAAGQKLTVYRAHAVGGITVLALTLIRLIWRFMDRDRPELPAGMSGPMRFAARAAHWLIYLLMLAITGSGIATLIVSGLGEILFMGADRPIPDRIGVRPRDAHELFATLLMWLLFLHIAAALYHHYFRKDDVLRRMMPRGSRDR